MLLLNQEDLCFASHQGQQWFLKTLLGSPLLTLVIHCAMVNQVHLSPSQQAAVNAPWKRQMYMVLSTAGSGKTLVLTKRTVRIAESLLDENARNKRILCICFNQAMADEMYHRISVLLHEQNLSADVAVTRTSYTVSRVVTIEVRTFHGLGRYILNAASQQERDRVAVPSGYLNVVQGRLLAKMFYEALKRTGNLQPNDTEKSAKKTVYDILASINDLKGKGFDKACERYLLESIPFNEGETSNNKINGFDIYQSMLYERGVIDYGDMIWKSVRLLLQSKIIRNFLKYRYASVLVDEFQDVSASQLIMCKAAVEISQSLTLVGDDDQQIYSWRTSNEWFCHNVAKTVFPNLKTLVLAENRRCPGAIVRTAYAVISKNSGRAPKEIKPVRSDGAPVRIVGCKTLQLEKRFVVKTVQRLLQKVQHTGERILILFRNNELLLNFQHEFKNAGIPTTRCIRPKANVSVVGSTTLATLALITLTIQDVDADTFVWAVTTLSPNLDGNHVYNILTQREQIENREKPLVNVKRIRRTSFGRGASVYLERLKLHFKNPTSKVKTEHKQSSEDLIRTIKKCDELLIERDRLHQVEEVMRQATAIVKASTDMGSQGSAAEVDSDDFELIDQNGEYGGYDILVQAAKKVDSKSRQKEQRERERGPPRRVRVQTVEEVAAEDGTAVGSDLEDFAELFSSDVKKSQNKRRKAQGICSSLKDGLKTERLVTHLLDDINEFCNTVRRSLGDYSSGLLNNSTQNDMDTNLCPVLSTVHNAKGSTFSYVFLCGVNKYNFPNGQVVCGIGNALFGFRTDSFINYDPDAKHCQEERRVFFVAQTRAVTQFVCTYSGESGCRSTPKEFESIFIKEMLNGVAENGKQDVVEAFVVAETDIDSIAHDISGRQ